MLKPMPVKPLKPDEPSTETPHYHGHRMRLRERFRGAGADALSDYELLEMVLFCALPRGDVKPLAKSLIKKFGSFAEVVHAPATRLREIDGVSYKDIASTLSIPVGTVRSRVFRARDIIDHQLRRVHDSGLGRHTVQRAPQARLGRKRAA